MSAARRRAWGLNQPRFGGQPPITNGNRGGKKASNKGKRPIPNREDGGSHPERNGTPSTNGMLPG